MNRWIKISRFLQLGSSVFERFLMNTKRGRCVRMEVSTVPFVLLFPVLLPLAIG